jgi:hypothetical protein
MRSVTVVTLIEATFNTIIGELLDCLHGLGKLRIQKEPGDDD